jgi:hypothetical protein
MTIKTDLIQGPLLATLSAVLFGVSPVLCKLVIGEMSPTLLAGLLYGSAYILSGKHAASPASTNANFWVL